ncbi:hypothetical protein VTN00DRAFT_4088 [Thermoascus crustaceus]|uniref:uncharacterized protein n=1 Tax=Thermoascus crustaceus TaxID=5088 RepID=UPI0037443173
MTNRWLEAGVVRVHGAVEFSRRYRGGIAELSRGLCRGTFESDRHGVEPVPEVAYHIKRFLRNEYGIAPGPYIGSKYRVETRSCQPPAGMNTSPRDPLVAFEAFLAASANVLMTGKASQLSLSRLHSTVERQRDNAYWPDASCIFPSTGEPELLGGVGYFAVRVRRPP